MFRPRVCLAPFDSFRAALDGCRRSFHPRPEELPADAGLFQHGPQRDHGACPWLRRALGRPGHVSSHDVSFDYQAPAFLLRRKRPATREDRSVPRGQRGADPLDAFDRCRLSHGDSCSHRGASLQFVPERVHHSPGGIQRRLFRSGRSLHHVSRRDFLGIPHPHREPGARPGPRPSSSRDLPMEEVFCRGLGSGDYCHGFLDTRSIVPAHSGRSGHCGERTMRQAMSAFFEALQQKFGAQIQSMSAEREEEVYLHVGDPDIRALVEYLRNEFEARLVTVFAEDRRSAEGVFFNYYVLERKGDPRYLIVRAPVPADHPQFPSLSAGLPAVNWQEREIQDWFGLKAAGHPNPRRVALHDNWPDVHPLRKDFPLETVLPPFEGERHIYRPALGEGVFQVPVGPVHAGIIEPGHFNFAMAGEPILYLQLRMFYTHKGTEKLFENLPIGKAVFLAESISGDSSFSHGAAFCQAIERAAGIDVPPPALILRTILLEL